MPATIRFNGLLFLCLAYNNRTMPLQADRAAWKLSSSVAATWQHLEDTLLFVAGVLIPKLGMIFPLSFTDCPMPRTKGYLRTHKTSNIALQCALKSRDAFLPLIAKCSMAIAHATNDGSPTTSTPWWIEYLKTNHNLHPEMLESLRQSCVGNLSHPRVGVIVHVATCQYFNLIKTMLRVEIPIWFYWGSCKSRPPKAGFKWVDSLCPTPDKVSALLMPNASSSDTSGLPQEPEPLPRLPAPEPKSGQKPGETWQQFFDRQAVRLAQKESCETPEDRRRRLDREHSAADTTRGIPLSGYKVFVWMDEQGFRV